MTRNRIFIRDDRETELQVDYTISGGSQPYFGYGNNSLDDPGSGVDVEIERAWLLVDADRPDAPEVTLTDAEVERFTEEVNEDPDTWVPDDPPDY